MLGCTPTKQHWERYPVKDNGGFSVLLPNAVNEQMGALLVGTDSVPTHVTMAGDSGITFIAAWYDLPAAARELPDTDKLELAWTAGLRNTVVVEADTLETMYAELGIGRHAWIMTEEGVRLGIVQVLMKDRVIVLNAAFSDAKFSPRIKDKMERFFGSLLLDE